MSRSLLPLARRGRSHFSSGPNRLLCSNCKNIKYQQQFDILKNQKQEKFDFNHTTVQITINFNLSSEQTVALNNHQYQSDERLIWKINTSGGNTIDLFNDTGSLTVDEKKTLVSEIIRKLQLILNNRSSSATEHDQNYPELTNRVLQTTINILSSSQNSI